MLVEKYRPRTLDDFVLSDDLRIYVQQALQTRKIQHTLLYGRAGTGKSSLIQFLIRELGDETEVLTINASDSRGIDTVRDLIHPFATSFSFGDTIRFVDLREAEKLTTDAQDALKDIIEENHDRCIFLFSTNNPSKIIEPIVSRCAVFKVTPPSIPAVCKRVWSVVQSEGITMEREDVKTVVTAHFPDIRSVLNSIEKAVSNGVYNPTSSVSVDTVKYEKIIELLSVPTKKASPHKEFKELRALALSLELHEIEPFYTYLIDHVERVIPEQGCYETIVIIADYMHNSVMSVDKITSLSALLAHILSLKLVYQN